METHRGLSWKKKYLPLKTEKRHTEKLLCVRIIHFTELQLSPQEALR
ncbi:nef attachable domain protein [Chlamydia psittaci 02DC14]|nr:nef attachable domain protein [Chlamydia psittaci 02DC14]